MKLGVVGCGNMGGTMVRRWLKMGLVQANEVIAATRTEREAETVRKDLGVSCVTDPATAIAGRGLVLLAIKPQQVADVLPPLAGVIPRGQIWLSVLAGTPRQRIESLLSGGLDAPESAGVEVVRLMPNTPARIGLGVTAACFGEQIAADSKLQVQSLLAALGAVVEIPESQMDNFSAIAGSGPAYVFLFLEALAEEARARGFDADAAQTIANAMVRGAIGLAQDDGRAPALLRREVTSPKGMTEAAIKVLMERDWPGHLREAIGAAASRGAELAG